MIRFLQNHEIDRQQWDYCIEHAYNGNIYAWSWYLDIVCPEWNALVKGRYSQVFPLTARRKWGIPYISQPPFAQQLGLFSCGSPGNDSTNEFIEQLLRHYSFAEMNLNSYNLLSVIHGKLRMLRNYELDLLQPYMNLRLMYSENAIRNILKAQKGRVSVSPGADPKAIIDLFRENKGTELKNFSPSHYQIIERLSYACLHRRAAVCYGAYSNQNQLIAGAILFQSHSRMVLIFSASNAQARETGAMHLLIDTIIQCYAGKSITFDFEGSEIPGLARFYSGFGPKEVKYPQLHINRLALIPRIAVRIIKAMS